MVLGSMSSMIRRGAVPASFLGEMIEAACAIWPTDPRRSMPVLLTADTPPSNEAVASLIDPLFSGDPSGDDEGLLAKVWFHFAAIMSEEDRLAVAMLLLQKSPKNAGGEPDVGLGLWTQSQPSRPALLEQLLSHEELTDEQRARVWAQVQLRTKELGPTFFVDMLPTVLTFPDSPYTLRSVLQSRGTVGLLYSTPSAKNTLARVLLETLIRSGSLETKNNMATWLREIGGGGALRSLEELNPTQDDLRILEQRFSGSKSITRLLHRT
jgi:hypothetical protein